MADENPSPEVDSTPGDSTDFAEVAIRSLSEETAKEPRQEKPPEPKEPKEQKEEKHSVPDQLFKKEEKRDEKPPESEIDKFGDPEFKNPQRKAQWDELKSKAKDYESKYSEALKKLQDAESKGKDTSVLEEKLAKIEKEYAAREEKLSEYQRLVQQVNVELDPEFRKTHIEGRQNLISRAQKLIEESGLDPKQVEVALNLKGKARVDALSELAEGMNHFQTSRLGKIVDDLDALDDSAAAKRGNPEEFLRKQQETSRKAQEQAEEAHRQKSIRGFQDAIKEIPSDSIMARKLDGVDWWNKEIDTDLAKAQQLWETNTDPKLAAKLFIKGVLQERAERAFIDMRTERDTYKEKLEDREKELEKLYGNGPKITPGGGAKDGGFKDFASQVAETANLR